ncbi:MAG: RsiV family protein [Pseudomonadota bacterium]
MPFCKMLTFSSLALMLAACNSLLPSPAPTAVQRIAWEQRQTGCQGESCALVNIDTLRFPADPPLDDLVERALLEMTRDAPKAALPASLKAYEQQFLGQAQAGWTSYLQAKVRDQRDDLVIVELSSYLFTGGAHGMPGRGFINYDRNLQQALSLDDMLLPGRQAVFWDLVQQAHQAWLIREKLDQDEAFVRDWPFQQTANIALTSGALSLKYDVYSIAPYAMGHPELKLPYPRLKGILKPQYLPSRG